MYQFVIKRLIDIMLSLILLPFLVIAIFLVGIIIKLEDGGPIFFLDTRLGFNQNKFTMFKFRSMTVNAPDIRNSDGTTYNAPNDNRVTNVGRVIRKLSIDELPQLINVLKGDMSFVGPRPSPLGDKSIYPVRFFDKFKVKPGVTGYNQAYFRNGSSMDERIKHDSYYVEQISFLLDFKIVLRTIKTVFSSNNVYRNQSKVKEND